MKTMQLYIQCYYNGVLGSYVMRGDELVTEVCDSCASLFETDMWKALDKSDIKGFGT